MAIGSYNTYVRAPLADAMEGSFNYLTQPSPVQQAFTAPAPAPTSTTTATNNDAYYMSSPALQRERVMQIIANRGATVTVDEVNSLVSMVQSGQTSFDGIRQIVETTTFSREVSNPRPGTTVGGTAPGTSPGGVSEADRLQAILDQQRQMAAEELARQNQAYQQQARAMVVDLLNQLGLPASLIDVVDGLIKNNAPAIEINQRIRETQEYKTRFRGLELRRQNGLNLISEGEYIAYENTIRQAARRFGMSREFIDERLGDMIGNDVGLPEALERIEQGYAAAMSAPREVRDQLFRFYGIDEGRLAEFFIDPDRATRIIMREFQAARAGGTAAQTGFGLIERGQAERLADLGLSGQMLEQGFSGLAQSRQIMRNLAGEFGRDELSVDEQLSATFESNADAQSKIRRRRERRTAAFQGEGGAAANQTGVLGLGTSNI